MNLASIVALLTPFEPLLKSGALVLEGDAKTELANIIAKVSSPDLQQLLTALAGALDSFGQLEINKLS